MRASSIQTIVYAGYVLATQIIDWTVASRGGEALPLGDDADGCRWNDVASLRAFYFYKLRHRSPAWLASVATHACLSILRPSRHPRAVVAMHTVGLTLADHVAVAVAVAVATKSSSRRRDSEGARAPR